MIKTSGPQKAAILLATLGPGISADVLRYCSEPEIEQVTGELLNLDDMSMVDSDVQGGIMDEAFELSKAAGGLPTSGGDYVWDMLAQMMGESSANDFIRRIQMGGQSGRPFSFMEGADTAQLAKFLESEHPQITAVIISHLKPRRAAEILSQLSPELQQELAERLLRMERVAPEVLSEVEDGLSKRLAPMLSRAGGGTEMGIDSLVDILKRASRGTEKNILEHLKADPELAEQVRKKMFVFEDLTLLDDTAVRRVMRDVDSRDLPLALRGVSMQIQQLIFRNMSSRAREMLQEEMAATGPQRLTDVEEAQQRIGEVVRQLAEAEEIVIARGEAAETLV